MDDAREKILGRILPRVTTACDLACGTGATALLLARRGIRTYGVDLSAEMCRLARQKALRDRLPLRIIQADMRRFRLPEPVDLVTCEFDALNHIPTRAGLGLVARAVHRALNPGGYFFFDVNNSLGFQRYWSGVVWFERPGIVMVMRNGHNRNATRAWSDIELFVSEGNLWKRHCEHVEEVCWERDTIRGVFEQSGLGSLRAWDGAPFFNNSLIAPGCRTVYLVRKSLSL